jgi:hypothetical protein
MALIKQDSRSRIAIEWYDDEAEADTRAKQVLAGPGVGAANIGYVQVGRDKGFDQTVDGVRLFAVVTP